MGSRGPYARRTKPRRVDPPADPSRFVLEVQRLHRAQLAAETPDDRAAADDRLTHLLRMNAVGRLAEYFANRDAEDTHARP